MAHSRPTAAEHPADRLVGTSPGIAALRVQIQHLARFDTLGSAAVPTVLLQGETGTGKGLVARVMHDSGPRATGPFIAVNCAAIPETMLEAELFGFEPGAFTDAKRAKAGLFEAASGGTLLLDEIDALPFVLQGKLLTAIETKRVRRLGAVAERAVDVKLIAATNAVLTAAMAAGRFRADLYHRLAVVVLALPPLRERGADILALAQALLQHYATVHSVTPKQLQDTAQAWLQHYAWPGNVREWMRPPCSSWACLLRQQRYPQSHLQPSRSRGSTCPSSRILSRRQGCQMRQRRSGTPWPRHAATSCRQRAC
jgi:two-component system, NtrC family, response regulator AtoC